MIVVDTSAFIEYYRPGGLRSAQERIASIIAADQVAVNGIIQVEIVAFARTEADRRMLLSDFAAFHRLALGQADYDLATELGFSLRRKAVTIPATDLIIAASTLRAGASLLHLDSHFDRIAEHSDLQAVNLGQG
jgi:predicted nucleic acid-binding protein